jgi:hypothetical protein
VEAVGDPGEPGVDLRSLAGLLPLVVLSPDRRSEFCRDSPVPEKDEYIFSHELGGYSSLLQSPLKKVTEKLG